MQGSNQGNVRYLGADYIEKKAFTDYYSNAQTFDPTLLAHYSVKAETIITAAFISIEELCEISTKECIYNMCFTPDVFVYGLKEMAERYVQDRAWKVLKRESTRLALERRKKETIIVRLA